ncbi:MAG TPA: RDD family protein [Candidatus Elarobacter sp.]|nr:RDD family protein [Candidatus Elarobacter sp.]
MSAAAQPRADELLGRRRRRERMLVTPDGVPLRIEIADAGERATAFTIDFGITSVVAYLLLIAAMLFSWVGGGAVVAAFTFVAFVVRNAYFVAFELGWGGVTPGKRFIGLRVIDRHGGALTAAAVVARNLTREVEIFFPLAMVLQTESWVLAPWEIVPLAAWLLLTSALPLCNRDRLRAGDLIGGTIVIAVPKKLLLPELVADRRLFTFTAEMLERYGILELQVLEDVLRRSDASEQLPLLMEIAEKIRRKIRYPQPVAPRDTYAFLRDFYAAQREFLELRRHLGDERADKHYGERARRPER